MDGCAPYNARRTSLLTHTTQVFIQQLFIQAANVVTFVANNADLSRYARRPNDALWTQLIGFTASYGMIAFFGILITSSSGITLKSGKVSRTLHSRMTECQVSRVEFFG